VEGAVYDEQYIERRCKRYAALYKLDDQEEEEIENPQQQPWDRIYRVHEVLSMGEMVTQIMGSM
jgi:hypothetical protein